MKELFTFISFIIIVSGYPNRSFHANLSCAGPQT